MVRLPLGSAVRKPVDGSAAPDVDVPPSEADLVTSAKRAEATCPAALAVMTRVARHDGDESLGDVRGVAGGDVLATLDDVAHLRGGFVDHTLGRCLGFVTHAGDHVVDLLLQLVHALLHVVATGTHALSGNDTDTDGNVRNITRNFCGGREILAEIDVGEVEGLEWIGELKFWHDFTVPTSANFCKHDGYLRMWHASSVG